MTVANTHDIYKLVRMSRDNGSNVIMTSWLEDRADTLTRWEMDTRYNMDYTVELRPEFSDQKVREKLLSFFPKNFRPADDFEWNCYYQIYRKKIEK